MSDVVEFSFTTNRQTMIYPRTNLPHRFLTSGTHRSMEMALMNVAPILQHRTLPRPPKVVWGEFASAEFVPSVLSSILTYSKRSARASFGNFWSDELSLITTQYNIEATGRASHKMTLGSQLADVQVPTTTGTMQYQSRLVRSLVLLGYAADLTLPAEQQTYITTGGTVKFRMTNRNHSFATAIEPIIGAQTVEYGTDESYNTFYSLKGLFFYIKHKYPNLMDTAYHIQLKADILNLYDQYMHCLETHRLGLKQVQVGVAFLKDANGVWLSPDDIDGVYSKGKFVFYAGTQELLCTYDFNNIIWNKKDYYSLNSSVKPPAVSLSVEPFSGNVYGMPYDSAPEQKITDLAEYWNTLQVDGMFGLADCASNVEALTAYSPDILTITGLSLTQLVLKYGTEYVVLSTAGTVERSLYRYNSLIPNEADLLLTYVGSKILHVSYPYVYFAEYTDDFHVGADFGKIVRLDINTLDRTEVYSAFKACRIERGLAVWFIINTIDGKWQLSCETSALTADLSTVLSLGELSITDVKVFGAGELFILLSNRTVVRYDIYSNSHEHISTRGVPIKLVKFNEEYGCVLTRLDELMLFEQLQPVYAPSDSSDWHTPSDMRPGEVLKPVVLYESVLLRRTASIKPLLSLTVIERFNVSKVELVRGVIDNMNLYVEANGLVPVHVGAAEQKLLAAVEYNAINPVSTAVSIGEYSKSLEYTIALQDDLSFTVDIKPLPFPESIPVGFRINEK